MLPRAQLAAVFQSFWYPTPLLGGPFGTLHRVRQLSDIVLFERSRLASPHWRPPTSCQMSQRRLMPGRATTSSPPLPRAKLAQTRLLAGWPVPRPAGGRAGAGPVWSSEKQPEPRRRGTMPVYPALTLAGESHHR